MYFIPGRDRKPLLLPEILSKETLLLGLSILRKVLSHPCADAQNHCLSSDMTYLFDI